MSYQFSRCFGNLYTFWIIYALLGLNELMFIWLFFLMSSQSAQVRQYVRRHYCWEGIIMLSFLLGHKLIPLNSLAPGKFQQNFRYVIFKLISVTDGWGISCKITLRWMPLNLTNDKSTLVQLGQLPETCESWLHLVNRCVYYAHQTREINQLLPYSVDFKAPGELWNPMCKAIHGKFCFIRNKGPVNIWNNRKTEK